MSEAKVSGKHPKGLYVLFFTEMWERFGYYLMIGILLLYLTDTMGNGGMGMDITTAVDIVGTYIALVYLTPFIGGLVADRYIGYTKAIFLGGALMALAIFFYLFMEALRCFLFPYSASSLAMVSLNPISAHCWAIFTIRKN